MTNLVQKQPKKKTSDIFGIILAPNLYVFFFLIWLLMPAKYSAVYVQQSKAKKVLFSHLKQTCDRLFRQFYFDAIFFRNISIRQHFVFCHFFFVLLFSTKKK